MIMKLNSHLKLVEQPEMKYIGEIKLEILTIDAFQLNPKMSQCIYDQIKPKNANGWSNQIQKHMGH